MRYLPLILFVHLTFFSCQKEDITQPCDRVMTTIIDTAIWELPFSYPGQDEHNPIFYLEWTPYGILAEKTDYTNGDSLFLIEPLTGQVIWKTILLNPLEPNLRSIPLREKNIVFSGDLMFIGNQGFIHTIMLASGELNSYPVEGGMFEAFGHSPYDDRIWYIMKDCPGQDVVYTIRESDLQLSTSQILRTDTYPYVAFSDSYKNVNGWIDPNGVPYLVFRIQENTAGETTLILQNAVTGEEIWQKKKDSNAYYSLYSTHVTVIHDKVLSFNAFTEQLTCYQLPSGVPEWTISTDGIWSVLNDWVYVSKSGLTRIHIQSGQEVNLAETTYKQIVARSTSSHIYLMEIGKLIALRTTTGCPDLVIKNPHDAHNRYWASEFIGIADNRNLIVLSDRYSIYGFRVSG